MKNRISALMDGELDTHEIDSTLDALQHDSSLRADWHSYHRIGDVLRHEANGSMDITDRVLAALENEPTIVAPLQARHSRWRHPALSLAASLAGMAIVGWVGFGRWESVPGNMDYFTSVTSAAPVATNLDHPRQVSEFAPASDSTSLQAYVVAHQAHGSAQAFAGSTHYVRTVSVVKERR